MKMFRSVLILLIVGLFAFPAAAQIQWMSWEEAVAANEREPRKFLVDVYTDWCGWCKKMDSQVFTDPKISAYVQQHFYAVKLNAEQKATIQYDGHTFKFDPKMGRRGAHELAYSLLDGRMSYPSFVYLDENIDRITISPGFKPAAKYINELSYIEGGHYRTRTYQEYLAALGKK